MLDAHTEAELIIFLKQLFPFANSCVHYLYFYKGPTSGLTSNSQKLQKKSLFPVDKCYQAMTCLDN